MKKLVLLCCLCICTGSFSLGSDFPMRRALGAVLVDAGRPEQAEDVYCDDLKQWPNNGWSLYGLMRSLRAPGRMDEAGLPLLDAFLAADVEATSFTELVPLWEFGLAYALAAVILVASRWLTRAVD